MPELPEVEVIKQSLDRKIKFQKINKVLVRNRNLYATRAILGLTRTT